MIEAAWMQFWGPHLGFIVGGLVLLGSVIWVIEAAAKGYSYYR